MKTWKGQAVRAGGPHICINRRARLCSHRQMSPAPRSLSVSSPHWTKPVWSCLPVSSIRLATYAPQKPNKLGQKSESPQTLVAISAPPGASRVTSGESLAVSEPQFPHCRSRRVGSSWPPSKGARSFSSPDPGGRAGGARPGEGRQPRPRRTCVPGASPPRL